MSADNPRFESCRRRRPFDEPPCPDCGEDWGRHDHVDGRAILTLFPAGVAEAKAAKELADALAWMTRTSTDRTVAAAWINRDPSVAVEPGEEWQASMSSPVTREMIHGFGATFPEAVQALRQQVGTEAGKERTGGGEVKFRPKKMTIKARKTCACKSDLAGGSITMDSERAKEYMGYVSLTITINGHNCAECGKPWTLETVKPRTREKT